MSHPLIALENHYWQAGVLPETGASLAYGRIRQGNDWADILRPTPEEDYGNSSNCSSFIMLPWCNRIRRGLLRFEGRQYPLTVAADDGTARHGDVRRRPWKISQQDETGTEMRLDSSEFPDMNWPFQFSARAEYRLEGPDFIWTLALENTDTVPMPAGFGHHPYFVRRPGVAAPRLQVNCDRYFELTDFMATAAPIPLVDRLDFRRAKPLPGTELNDLLSGRQDQVAARLEFPDRGVALEMICDAPFAHVLVFVPVGKAFFAVEPMTSASDGFNLLADGIEGSGVVTLGPGQTLEASVRLRLLKLTEEQA